VATKKRIYEKNTKALFFDDPFQSLCVSAKEKRTKGILFVVTSLSNCEATPKKIKEKNMKTNFHGDPSK